MICHQDWQLHLALHSHTFYKKESILTWALMCNSNNHEACNLLRSQVIKPWKQWTISANQPVMSLSPCSSPFPISRSRMDALFWGSSHFLAWLAILTQNNYFWIVIHGKATSSTCNLCCNDQHCVPHLWFLQASKSIMYYPGLSPIASYRLKHDGMKVHHNVTSKPYDCLCNPTWILLKGAMVWSKWHPTLWIF